MIRNLSVKLIAGLIAGLAATSATTAARAQVTMDMSKVTCADYLAMSPDVSDGFAAWMSGWFNQKGGSTTINLEGFESNVANVRSWCQSNPREVVMAGLERAFPKAPAAAGGPTSINVSEISCAQLLNAPPERQMLIGSWVGGYLSSTKNIVSIDSRYLNRNTKVIASYCAKNKKQPLMRAAEKNWR